MKNVASFVIWKLLDYKTFHLTCQLNLKKIVVADVFSVGFLDDNAATA
jgi:hypothetical protein